MKSVRSSLTESSLASARRLNATNIEEHFNVVAFTNQGHRTTRIVRAALKNTVQTELGKESKKNGRVISNQYVALYFIK